MTYIALTADGRRIIQPRLKNKWGMENFGRAETDGFGSWWYTDRGFRYPLLPTNYNTEDA